VVSPFMDKEQYSNNPEYKKGYIAGYELGAKKLPYWLLNTPYNKGYRDGYKDAGIEADEAFQSQYSQS
jgi:hypothetical protein